MVTVRIKFFIRIANLWSRAFVNCVYLNDLNSAVCAVWMQVLRLLEVPGEKVTASSAAFALQRLSQLCSATGNDDMDSFVRKAVLHELCETVVQGICQLPNSTMVSLAGDAALASSGYDVQFVCQVNNEVSITSQTRIIVVHFRFFLCCIWYLCLPDHYLR